MVEQLLEEAAAQGEAAWQHEQAGRIAEAEAAYRGALELYDRAGEGEGDAAASLLHDLGAICRRLHKLDEAERCFRAALAIFESQGDDGAADRGNILLALGGLLKTLGRCAEALAAHERAVEIYQGLVARLDAGEEVPEEVARMIRGLYRRSLAEKSGVLVELGRYPEADAAAQRALSSAQAHRAEPLELAGLWNALGVARKYRGHLDAAAACYAQAQESLATCAATDSELAASVLHNLAGLAHARGDFAAGEEPARKALALREAQLGPEHPDLAIDLHGLASILGSTGQVEAARTLYLRAIALTERAYGPVHREVAVNVNNLGSLALREGAPLEAESLFRRALAVKEQLFGGAHPDVAFALFKLAGALRQLGKEDEEQRLSLRALSIAQAQLEEGHPRRVAIEKAAARWQG